MICRNCGAKFSEGIFCPECGTQIEDGKNEKIPNADREFSARKSAVKEPKKREEQEILLAREKAEAEKARRERLEMEARIYNGVVYDSECEARRARDENNKIDLLKQKLEATKLQLERQQIIADFKDEITTMEAKKRLEMLRQKVSQPMPKAEKNNKYLGIISWLAFAVSFVLSIISESELLSILAALLMMAGFIGIIVWIIRKITNSIRSKTRGYYLNLKDI